MSKKVTENYSEALRTILYVAPAAESNEGTVSAIEKHGMHIRKASGLSAASKIISEKKRTLSL